MVLAILLFQCSTTNFVSSKVIDVHLVHLGQAKADFVCSGCIAAASQWRLLECCICKSLKNRVMEFIYSLTEC